MRSLWKSHGFTLVELIVTITILTILWTIAFISFEKYSSSARDAVRVSNAANLYKALSLVNIRNGSFPLPENPSVTFTYSGAAIWYQWYAGNNIQSIAKVGNSMNDSITKTPFTYSVNSDKKKAQILWFLEDQSNIVLTPSITNQAYAASIPLYPFTIWDNLGMVVSNTGWNLNVPLQVSNTGSFELKITDALVGYSSYQSSKTALSNQELLSLASTYGSIPRTKQVKLTEVTDAFGVSVAISADGNTAIVGATGDDPGGVTDAGAAYVFIRSGKTWTEQAKLTASDKATEDDFGVSVAISADGNTTIIGVRYADHGGVTNAGAAYVFIRSGKTWTEQAKLIASDKVQNDRLGQTVSISADGNTAIVGASYANPGGVTDAGAAYVFARSGTAWSEQQKLTASDKATGDYFGQAASISADGNTAIVGAYAADPEGLTSAGAAYVFARSGTAWSEQQKLTASDKATGDHFGYYVAISADGNSAIFAAYLSDPGGVTDAGAAYVFIRSGTTWTEQAKLTASDKATGDWFSRHAVSISSDGNIAIVGARYADPRWVTDAGAAYVFIRSGTTWTEQAKLTASDKATGDYFGQAASISADGNTAIVGAMNADPGGVTDAGAVYMYQ